MHTYHNLLVKTVEEAGKAILEIYNSEDMGIEIKGDESPLTRADKAAHHVIAAALESTGLPVLSEEGRDISYDERSAWKQFWMVDPLDGTKEFIKKNGEFSVNIALIENGVPIFGAVHIPVSGRTFIGGEGHPAIVIDGNSEKPLKIKDTPTSLDTMKGLKNIRVVASRSHLNEDTQNFMDSLDSPEIVSMGSSLKFMAIADEQADVYPRFAPTMEWDTAAAHAVARSLGYRVLRLDDMEELSYNKENLLNPYFICY